MSAEARAHLERAALLCKADLTTQVVAELSALQGAMGREYALASDEHGETADAIGEHYRPRFSGDAVPRTKLGRLLAIADKLDTLTLRILLSDPAGQALTEGLIEVRINNLLLGPARVEGGWLAFPVRPVELAAGDNLVGVRVTNRLPDSRDQISIEKLELHVNYR